MRGKRFQKKKGPCHHCGKLGHYKRNCWKLTEKKGRYQKESNCDMPKGDIASVTQDNTEVLLTSDVLFVGSGSSWIVDSGATSHMCRARSSFSVYEEFQEPGGGVCE